MAFAASADDGKEAINIMNQQQLRFLYRLDKEWRFIDKSEDNPLGRNVLEINARLYTDVFFYYILDTIISEGQWQGNRLVLVTSPLWAEDSLPPGVLIAAACYSLFIIGKTTETSIKLTTTKWNESVGDFVPDVTMEEKCDWPE